MSVTVVVYLEMTGEWLTVIFPRNFKLCLKIPDFLEKPKIEIETIFRIIAVMSESTRFKFCCKRFKFQTTFQTNILPII